MMETITREEKLLEAIAEGKTVDITPVTRREMFLAKAAGQNVKTPEPITREEILLSKIHTGGGGLRDIIENGIYELYDADATEVAFCAFAGLSTITSVDLPSVFVVGQRAFENCESLKSVNLPQVEAVYPSAFSGCVSLENLYLPNCTILRFDSFKNCTSLKTVNLPNISTQMSDSVFKGCSALEKVDIGKSPTHTIGLGGSIFADCTSLTTIILRDTENVFLTGMDTIQNTPIVEGRGFMYIPASMWDAYTAVYGDYMVMFRKIEDYPEICG